MITDTTNLRLSRLHLDNKNYGNTEGVSLEFESPDGMHIYRTATSFDLGEPIAEVAGRLRDWAKSEHTPQAPSCLEFYRLTQQHSTGRLGLGFEFIDCDDSAVYRQAILLRVGASMSEVRDVISLMAAFLSQPDGRWVSAGTMLSGQELNHD